MILRHAREPVDGQSAENTFEAIDERSGAVLGECTIYVHESPELFPSRPKRIYLDIQGDPTPDALLGAAVARAKDLARQSALPCRIFTQLTPDNQDLMDSLSVLGFKDSDGLVCMRRELYDDAACEAPITCVLVKDRLDDPLEQKFFLERYNELFNEDYDFEWLQEFTSQKDFKRLLFASPTGMAGEIVIWTENGTGRIGWIYTSRKWRRLGVARSLLDHACAEFRAAGLISAEAEVQARIPGMLRAMESAGFRQSELILRYPGIDIG